MSLDDKVRNYLFVLNPISGGKSKKKDHILDAIQRFCLKNNFSFRIYETSGNNDADTIRDIIYVNDITAVVAIGGDGTVHLVGSILVGTEIPLGIIPTGSANGLAKDLNLPLEPEEALKIISRVKPAAIDTLKINNKHSFHISDIGFNARIIQRFSDSIIRGKISYLWYGLVEFFSVKPFRYVVETPLLRYEGESFMMIITNTNQFGTDVIINPLGKIDDGYFEIIIIKPFTRWVSPDVIVKLLTNSIHRSRYSKLIRCKEALISNPDRELLHIDGEPQEIEEKINIKILPKSLWIFKP